MNKLLLRKKIMYIYNMTSSLHGQRLNRGNDEGEYGEEFMRNLRRQVIINGGIPDERVLQGAFNINDNDLTDIFNEYI